MHESVWFWSVVESVDPKYTPFTLGLEFIVLINRLQYKFEFFDIPRNNIYSTASIDQPYYVIVHTK